MITWYEFGEINRAIADTETGANIKTVLRLPGH
jgi:hypothetical protein